ncbi:MAG: hypothetical protein ILP19_00485 [Oscillospiraceae bacterium]|nr:hypothetical protein [Oscillospiraceae bacterium]
MKTIHLSKINKYENENTLFYSLEIDIYSNITNYVLNNKNDIIAFTERFKSKKADLEDYFSNEKVKEITHYDTVFQSEKCYGYCYSEYNGSDNGVTYIFEIRSPDNVSFLFSVECDGDAIYVYDNHYTTMYRDRRD